VALTTATLVLIRARAIVRHHARPPLAAGKAAWFTAASTSAAVLGLVAARVGGLLPNPTVVDVGALATVGVLTGLFLGFALTADRVGVGGGS